MTDAPAATGGTGGLDAAVWWQWCPFEALSAAELYALLALRQLVFVVEQRCAYLDADGLDPVARHLLGWGGRGEERRLLAAARVFPVRPGDPSEAAIGRVVTAPSARGRGLGHALMAGAIARCEAIAPGRPIRIQAQSHLGRFYAGLGFRPASAPYLVDGIVHLDMIRPVAPPA